MNSNITHLTAFLVGVTAGGALAWDFARKKYERIAEEEINSVKETYAQRKAVVVKSADEPAASEPAQHPKESVLDYAAKLRHEGYLPKEDTGKKEEDAPPVDKPYIISPEEFGEMYGYEQISLTYYSDGSLADENDELVEDADEVVGLDSLTRFGEYEEDSVFVRNDALRCDYEILADQRTYAEVLKEKPYLHRKE